MSYESARNALTGVVAHYGLGVETLEGLEKELLLFLELNEGDLDYGIHKRIHIDTFLLFALKHFLSLIHAQITSFASPLLQEPHLTHLTYDAFSELFHDLSPLLRSTAYYYLQTYTSPSDLKPSSAISKPVESTHPLKPADRVARVYPAFLPLFTLFPTQTQEVMIKKEAPSTTAK